MESNSPIGNYIHMDSFDFLVNEFIMAIEKMQNRANLIHRQHVQVFFLSHKCSSAKTHPRCTKCIDTDRVFWDILQVKIRGGGWEGSLAWILLRVIHSICNQNIWSVNSIWVGASHGNSREVEGIVSDR